MDKQYFTTVEQNLRGRVEFLEKLLGKMDSYLETHERGILPGSAAHRDIKRANCTPSVPGT